MEDVNERLRKAAESENGRDMVDRVCNPAIVSDKQLWHDRKPKETGEGRLIDGERVVGSKEFGRAHRLEDNGILFADSGLRAVNFGQKHIALSSSLKLVRCLLFCYSFLTGLYLFYPAPLYPYLPTLPQPTYLFVARE